MNDGGIATLSRRAEAGTVIWQQRLGGTYSASPVFADGRIYFLGRARVTTVIAPGKEFRRLATNPLDGWLAGFDGRYRERAPLLVSSQEPTVVT